MATLLLLLDSLSRWREPGHPLNQLLLGREAAARSILHLLVHHVVDLQMVDTESSPNTVPNRENHAEHGARLFVDRPLSPLPPVIRRDNDPPFHRLDAYAFQKMCRDIFCQEKHIESCEVYGTQGQPQFGIDLLAHRREDGIEVGQCKCYKRFTASQIRDASNEFFKYWSKWRPRKVHRFVLVTACHLDGQKEQDEIIGQKRIFSKKGIEYEAWSASTLRRKLSESTQCSIIVRTYFNPAEPWITIICNEESFVSVSVSRTLTSRMAEYEWTICDEVQEQLLGMRERAANGEKDDALKWADDLVADNLKWGILGDELKAKVLCFLAERRVRIGGDIQQAKKLVEKASTICMVEEIVLAEAWIAYSEEGPAAAQALLDERTDLESMNLRALCALKLGEPDRCIALLSFQEESENENA